MKSTASVGLISALALLALLALESSASKLQKSHGTGSALTASQPSNQQQITYMENVIPQILNRALAGKEKNNPTQQEGALCFGSEDPSMIIITLLANIPDMYVDQLRKNRLAVANAHNYKYCQYNHSLSSERDAAWSKVIAIRHFLDAQQKPVVWMDADAWFTQNKRFEDITDVHLKTDQKHIVFTDDLAPGPDSINTGVLVTTSTAWTKKFWASVYDDFPEAISHTFLWEQLAVILYKRKFQQDFADHAAIVPHKLMNNLLRYEAPFIAHAMGHVDYGLLHGVLIDPARALQR